MKDNTYVIPAIKFYILKPNKDCGMYFTTIYITDRFKEEIDSKNYDLIPFENVDGLTVEQMADILNIKGYYAIVAVAEITERRIRKQEVEKVKHYSILDMNVFNPKDRKVKELTVDKLYENFIELVYQYTSPNKRKIYNSFLEQYRYQDYEQTKQKIKEIKEK